MEKGKCPYCDKQFEGFSKKQVDNFMRQHVIAKHKDMVSWISDKNGKTS